MFLLQIQLYGDTGENNRKERKRGGFRGKKVFLCRYVAQNLIWLCDAFIKFYNLPFFNALIFLRFRVYFILMTDTLTDTTSKFFLSPFIYEPNGVEFPDRKDLKSYWKCFSSLFNTIFSFVFGYSYMSWPNTSGLKYAWSNFSHESFAASLK